MSYRGELQRERLTEEFISSLEYPQQLGHPKQRYIVHDIALPGFGVRVYPNGRKTYVMRYSINGQRMLIKMAECDYTALDDARRMARKLRDDIDAGIDPLMRESSS